MSPFPDFNEQGDLPVGVHRGSLRDTLNHFGKGSLQRQTAADRLERIHRLATGTGSVLRFVIFGSFITDKFAPNDVDIFLVMANDFDVSILTGEARYVFDHMAAHNLLGASIFWIPRAGCIGGEDVAVSDWQIKRDGTLRGLVEIIP